MKYLAQFPESLFSCKTKHDLEVYETRVLRGESIAAKSSVIICGLARNIENVFPYTIARIEQLGSMFKSYEVVIYENDSKDKTKELLNEWQEKNSNVQILSEDIGAKFHGSVKTYERKVDMSFYRNKYLDIVQKGIDLGIVRDYTIILDTDIVGGWSFEGVSNSLGFVEQDWSAISSNSIIYRKLDNGYVERLFYDTWGYRNLGSYNEVCGPEGNSIKYDRGDEPFLVNSNHGGLSIYKTKCLYGIRYTDDDCDVVTISRQINDKGEHIFFNPSMITLYSPTSYCFKLSE